MKGKMISLVVALFLSLAAPALTEPVGTQDEQVQAVSEPVLEALLAGFNKGDYAQYAKDFDDTMREAIPKKKFQQVRADLLKKLGPYKDRKYLGFLTQQPYTVVLWKGAFAGTTNDILIKLVLSRRGEAVKVVGLWFQ
ncbi:MAG: DUF3887 domain-containing protein [Desulfobaccales bacterium]